MVIDVGQNLSAEHALQGQTLLFFDPHVTVSMRSDDIDQHEFLDHPSWTPRHLANSLSSFRSQVKPPAQGYLWPLTQWVPLAMCPPNTPCIFILFDFLIDHLCPWTESWGLTFLRPKRWYLFIISREVFCLFVCSWFVLKCPPKGSMPSFKVFRLGLELGLPLSWRGQSSLLVVSLWGHRLLYKLFILHCHAYLKKFFPETCVASWTTGTSV